MCKGRLVIPVNRVEEEERHKGSLTKLLITMAIVACYTDVEINYVCTYIHTATI
jgi:hypothetical protein